MKNSLIRTFLAVSIISGWLFSPIPLSANDGYAIEDLDVDNAGELLNVCTIPPSHEHYQAAIAFCYGFFEGAIHYDDAVAGKGPFEDIVCTPDSATRTQAVAVFVDYLQANDNFEQEPPVEVVFRALVAKWPCE